jgi:hypothetical protein
MADIWSTSDGDWSTWSVDWTPQDADVLAVPVDLSITPSYADIVSPGAVVNAVPVALGLASPTAWVKLNTVVWTQVFDLGFRWSDAVWVQLGPFPETDIDRMVSVPAPDRTIVVTN